MRVPSGLLVLGLLLAASAVLPPAGTGQTGVAPCDLASRLSTARPDGACLLRRLTPLPPSPLDLPGALSDGPFVGVLPVRLTGAWRTGYPVDRNNGVAWSGRGGTAALTGGLAWRWRWLSGAVEPVLHGTGNRTFLLPDTVHPGRSRVAYPWAPDRLDWYLQPGNGGTVGLDPGDSWVEADLPVARVGVSHERLWWGPARRYPLLFGGSAGGFPHVYGRSRSLGTPVGTFAGQILWGRLDESDWLDADPRNDLRLLSAFHLRWRVDAVPGLELAWAVARHEPLADRSLRVGQLVQLVTGDPAGEDPMRRGTALGTLSVRLSLPDDGVEAYAQVGRGEGFVIPDPGVTDTRLSRVYVLGFSRSDTTASGGGWRVAGEVARQALELPQPDAPPPDREGAARTSLRHGHTHGGQLLGAWIGPGSNAQYLAFDRLDPARTWGVFLERVRRDDDTYFRTFVPRYGFRGHDVEWTVGARFGGWLDVGALTDAAGPLAFGIDAGLSRRKNRNFTGLRDENFVFLREWNAWADVWLEWDPRLRP